MLSRRVRALDTKELAAFVPSSQPIFELYIGKKHG
jgi:hypothetical protein